jgi:hypothetical protein
MAGESGFVAAVPKAEGGVGARSLARSRVGRVVEVRVRSLSTLADVQAINTQVAMALLQAGPGAIICADYRFASPFSCQVADAWAHGMRVANGRISGAALLLDPLNTMFNLQVERIVKCAGSPIRRLVTGLGEIQSWLGDSLSAAEWSGIETFLAAGDA